MSAWIVTVERVRSSTMRVAPSVRAFVADPVGRFLLGKTFVVWCHSPRLCGSAHWGTPAEQDHNQFLRVLEVARSQKLRPPFDVVSDVRRLEGLDPLGFDLV